MLPCHPRPTWVMPLVLLVPLAVSLAACGSSNDRFAPACPQPGIVRDAADITRYSGRGQDLTDLVLDGRITGLNGTCTRGDKDTVNTTVTIGIELNRGPATRGRTADLAYFVAVAEGERILDKRVFPLRAEFSENADRLRLIGDEVQMALPTPTGKSAAAYRVLVGFQLTEPELELNRRRGAR